MTVRACRACGAPLTPANVCHDRTHPAGFRSTCKPCHAAGERRRYWRDPERERTRMRARRRKERR